MKACCGFAAGAAVFLPAGVRCFVAGVRPAASSAAAIGTAKGGWGSGHVCRSKTSRERGWEALSMVSATFGERLNTDRIVLDKTAKEALAEEYPEALSKHPGFLGARRRSLCNTG